MTAFWPTLDTPTTRYTVQTGCAFLDAAYYRAEGSVHPAIDLNAVTGGNTDLGDPVHGVDSGVVVAVMWDGYIGGIVEIKHEDGSISGYWHLRDIHVTLGQRVSGGDLIGQIGKGAKLNMAAHLHFYVKKAGVVLAPSHWPSAHIKNRQACEAFVREHYHPPEHWLYARGAKRTLASLQALRGAPTTRVLVNDVEITGQLVQRPEHDMSIDARTETVRVYLNSREPTLVVPALPPGVIH
ncbi:M23 family metallopeptidase [Deinococcus sp. QL22]|uniref:M23 family metallopeptidase n=1 Tax=Deinococcus sp. QL22 TaxID=2939437 RepID=UPI002016AFD5|nr:M23 family metallopeptidase [Deinococcus sp. QL22]UQN10349.1 M23 family metallopeptidase [Deinococcus sp. QL22]UQN10483.1 M23 family metallopeptidase [Deinococcus sp. QL22]